MKKKFLKIVILIILIILIINFIISRINTINKLKENMTNTVENLFESISSFDYNNIKKYLKKPDGSDLSDQELLNFLYNTNLYRAMLVQNNTKAFSITPNINYFNTNNSTAIFKFNTISGQTIQNELKYVHKDLDEYLIADKIQECNKEKVSYSMFLDLANGDTININGTNESGITTYEVPFIKLYKNDDNTATFETFKEIIEDLKLNAIDILYDTVDSLKNINENYDIKWNDDYTEFSLYYDSNKNFMPLKTIFIGSVVYTQVFNGVSDWHLKINYYDYETKELLSTETIR